MTSLTTEVEMSKKGKIKRLQSQLRYYKKKSVKKRKVTSKMLYFTIHEGTKIFVSESEQGPKVMQHQALQGQLPGRRYSSQSLCLGIGALNVSRKCHEFIRANIMPLPSVTTLRQLTSACMEKVCRS